MAAMAAGGAVEVPVEGPRGATTFRVPPHFELIRHLGSGAYGCVAAFRNTQTGERIAVKKITNAFDNLDDGRRIVREVKLLCRLAHEKLVSILDILPLQLTDFDDIYIVMEPMDTTLQRVISSSQPLHEEHRQFFLYQMLRGVAFLHSADVVHRDIKPENILVNRDCDLKIADLGLARVLGQRYTDPTLYVVTRWYRAPEVVLRPGEYAASIDVWSLGCILCELFNRRPMFKGRDYLHQIAVIVRVLGTPSEEELEWLPVGGPARAFLNRCPPGEQVDWAEKMPSASAAAIDLARACLRFDPSHRISVRDALRHSFVEAYFEEADWETDTHHETPVDWTFDAAEPTRAALQQHIRRARAAIHPEIPEAQDLQGLLALMPTPARAR